MTSRPSPVGGAAACGGRSSPDGVLHAAPDLLACQADVRFDLVILDIMMPGMDGFACCRELPGLHEARFIIFLTAEGREVDKVVNFELGADDYG